MKNSYISKLLLLIFSFAFGIQTANADFSFSDMELRFAQVSDTHLSDAPDTSYKVLSRSKDLMRSAIKDLNDIKTLDFVVFTGDMVNEPTKKLYRDFFLELSSLKYPSLLVYGNHDSIPDSTTEKLVNILLAPFNYDSFDDLNEGFNVMEKYISLHSHKKIKSSEFLAVI